METIIILSSILLSIAISLGVGSSTVAICNFFAAIADGRIDESERNIMGVTYWILRVAMVLILLMLVLQYFIIQAGYITPYYGTFQLWASFMVTVVLYVNAVLMTYRVMPSTFGPAIQASSWYTLGIMATLIPLSIVTTSVLIFLLAYGAAFLLLLMIVNGVMSWLKHRT